MLAILSMEPCNFCCIGLALCPGNESYHADCMNTRCSGWVPIVDALPTLACSCVPVARHLMQLLLHMLKNMEC